MHCPPPPSSGFQYLECLRILEAFDLAALGHNSADYLHLLLETIKLASADRTRYASAEPTTIAALLSREYAAERRPDRPGRAAPSEGERFAADKDGLRQPGSPRAAEHTTHFEVADRWGNLVAVTQSNGAAVRQRLRGGIDRHRPEQLPVLDRPRADQPELHAPGQPQRDMPMAPCIVTRDGQLVLGIGTPGSYGILQTTLQMLLNQLDFGMNVQAAIEAPRVRAFEGTLVDVEGRVDRGRGVELRARGHDVRMLEPWTWAVGGGHGISADSATGALAGGADPRRDGQAVAF